MPQTSKGRWGQNVEDKHACSRCAYPTTNYPCLACGAYRCEPCFQYTQPCCDNMHMEDNRVPDMMHRSATSIAPKSNPHLKTIQCLSVHCLTATKVSVYEDRPTTLVEYKWCPKCGASAKVVNYYTLQDFYKMLSEALHLPIEIIEMSYPEWDRTKYTKYHRFVRHYINEALQDG